jgi:regulation of enolase protein 1 (concanavalin A-like superfamily)
MTTSSIHQRIYNNITHLQLELDAAFQKLLDQAGNRIQIDRQTELRQGMESTQQRLDKLKGQYI